MDKPKGFDVEEVEQRKTCSDCIHYAEHANGLEDCTMMGLGLSAQGTMAQELFWETDGDDGICLSFEYFHRGG